MNRMKLFCKFELYSDLGTFFVGFEGASLQNPKKKEIETETPAPICFFSRPEPDQCDGREAQSQCPIRQD